MRQTLFTWCLALSASLPVQAADPPPDDVDALSLADKAPQAVVQPVKGWRIFVEGAIGQGNQSLTDSRFDTSRATLDVRVDTNLTPSVRLIASDRLDFAHGNGATGAQDFNTLREAYLSWARTDDQIFALGRVNVRHGVATGFNPTDWFKEAALRSIVSPDPAMLRENRQGSVVLQGQKLWNTGALTASLSPRLGGAPDSATFAINSGATNPRTRWLLAGSYKFSDRVNPELLLYGGVDTPTQLGLNVSGLIGDAAVAFGELSTGRGRTLAAQALNLTGTERNQRRAALGLNYTTSFNLTFTVEAEYSSAAPDRAQWYALPGLAPAGPLRLLATAQTLQDLPARQAWFVHATWKDAMLRRLDVSAFLRSETTTNSRTQWLEARYRWPGADLAFQWQMYAGAAGSIYGSIPQRRTAELALRVYF